MDSNLVSERPPLNSLLRIFLLVVIVGWFVIGQVLGLVVGSLIYDGNFLTDIQHPAEYPNLKYAILTMQGVGSAIGLILIPAFYLKTSEQRNARVLFKEESQWPLLIAIVCISVFSLGPAISPVAEWNANFQFPEWMSAFGQWAKDTEATAAALIKTITSNLSPLDFIFSFVVIAIIPAMGEELVFRGLIQTELIRAVKNPHVAILIASILFSAIHFQFMGFAPRLLMGLFVGYLYFWSGNLWISILAHFFNNGFQLIGLYLYQKDMIPFDVESTDSAPWPLMAAGVVLLLSSMLYLKKYFESRTNLTRDHA